MFSENDIEDDGKQIIDDILKDIKYSDIFMQYAPPEKDFKIEKNTTENLNSNNILLPKRKKKKSLLFSTSKAISKKYKKIRQKKNDKLKFIKQVPLHPRHRLAHKVKSITSDNDKTFIKQVPLYPHNRLKRLTKDINDDILTINYVDKDVNIDDFLDPEIVNYTNIATDKHQKKVQSNYKWTKLKKSIRILNEKSMKK